MNPTRPRNLSRRYGRTQERMEVVRLILIQHPQASYAEVAEMVAQQRPDLMPSENKGTRKQLVYRAVKDLEAQNLDTMSISLPEAEDARRQFVIRMEAIFEKAMKAGDYRVARDAARDVAKACGADIDRPIKIELPASSIDLSPMETEDLAALVSALSVEDRAVVEAAFPQWFMTSNEEAN